MSSNWYKIKEQGNSEFKIGHYITAIDYYTRAMELNPNEPTLYSNRATCYKLLGKYRESLNDYKKAIQFNPKNTKNLKKLASVYTLLGNFGEAQIILQKCVNLEPNDSSNTNELNKIKKIIGNYEKINEKIKDKRWDDVEILSNQLIAEVPAFGTLKQIYIESLLENCKFKEAINFINSKVTSDEKNKEHEFLYLLSKAYYYKGDYQDAKRTMNNLMSVAMEEEKYTKLLKHINGIESVKKKANSLFKDGKLDEAIAEYTKLLEYDPENKNFQSIILANRALCYRKQNKLMEALKDVDEALKLNPLYVTGYIRRGHVYKDLKMYDDAVHDFQKVKELDPSNRDADSLIKEASSLNDQARNRDYYKILGIDRNATPEQIKKAYRKMALKWHPDRNSESEQSKKVAQRKFEDIGDAYAVLSDPKKKEMFDMGVDPLNPQNASGPNGPEFNGGNGMNFQFHGDPNEIFKMFFGGNGTQGNTQTFFTTSTDGNFGDFDDFFEGKGPGGFSQFFTNMGGNMGGNFQGQGGPFKMFFQQKGGSKKKKK